MVAAYEFLNQQAGYLPPAIALPGITCQRCRGTVNSGYSMCYRCGKHFPSEAFPDELGFGIYAQAGHQSGTVMRRYKGVPYSPLHRTIVLALAIMGIREATQRYRVDMITFVPSLGNRVGTHPLEDIIEQAALRTGHHGIVMRALGPQTNVTTPRGYVPSNFQALHSLNKKHVLLVDDTWASGGHLLSATGALRQGGAQNVIGLALARWLREGNTYREDEIVKTALDARMDFKNYKFF